LRSLQSALRRSSSLAILAAGASALVLGLAGPVAAQSIPGPLKVTDSGPSGSPGYAIKGITGFANDTGVFGYGTVASSAINIDGIVGYVQTQQSVGVVGWAASTGTSAYGVYGYSATGPGVYGFNANGAIASIYGVSTAAGGYAMYGSATSGVGVYGDSGGSDGVFGTTEVTGGGYGGVGGRDNSSAAGNFGTWGVSANGGGLYGASYGPGGTTGVAGIFAYAFEGSDSLDAFAYDESFFGVNSYNDNGITAGWFEAGNGSYGSEGGAGVFGLIATNDTSGAGAIFAEEGGTGAEITGENGAAATPVLAAEEDTAGMYAFSTYNDTSGNSGGPGPNNESFVVSDTAYYSGAGFTDGADVNISGDLYISGFIYDNCVLTFPQTSGADCDDVPSTIRPTSSGTKVHAYTTTASLPTMEDFGEGQLVNGQAAVPLEHTFASTIDKTRSYLVFITPEGDSHGLFVATKSASGFTVRESMGGHSTLAFQYRIVAHPYGDNSTRLSNVVAKPRGTLGGHRLAHPLMDRSPQFASLVAKAKTQRLKNGHLTVHTPARMARPAAPVVNAVLRKE
jgi:hypothetical protein